MTKERFSITIERSVIELVDGLWGSEKTKLARNRSSAIEHLLKTHPLVTGKTDIRILANQMYELVWGVPAPPGGVIPLDKVK